MHRLQVHPVRVPESNTRRLLLPQVHSPIVPESRYKPLYEIARGGMGRVELVVDQRLHFERLHARKRLHPHFLDDDNIRAMFLDEARIAGFIRHPHVVSVTDVGEDEEGPFIVMDFVDGVSLSAMVNHLAASQVAFPLSVVLSLMAQAAEGLHAAHEVTDSSGHRLGVVHRDVSPQNILVGFDGHARVADFGIAKALGGSSSRTETGVLKGKLSYSSPEVLSFEEASVRSDLFSFGVVLFEAVTMRRLYPASGGGPRAILNEPVPDLGDVVEDAPDELVELVFSLLAKNPAHRPRSAGDVAARLHSILRDLPFDDVMSVTDFVEEHFAEERTSQRRRIEDARSRVRLVASGERSLEGVSLDADSLPVITAVTAPNKATAMREVELASAAVSEAQEPTLPMVAASPKRFRPVWLALPVILLLAGAGAMWLTREVPPPAAGTAMGTIGRVLPPSAPSAPSAPSEEAPPSDEETSELLSEEEPVIETETEAAPEETGAMNSRRRRRRASMSAMRAPESNVPIWDEY